MKLTIENGETLENAMKYIQAFFDEMKDDYPILKTNLNIYITLKGPRNHVCPENEKEYILNQDGATDVEAYKIELAYKALREEWDKLVRDYEWEFEYAKQVIEADEKYLETATEKGKRPDLVAKRQKLLERHKKEYEESSVRLVVIRKLDDAVAEHRYKLHVSKLAGKTLYDYYIRCYFVFEDINGYSGYFDKRGLHAGFPYDYVE